MGRLYSNSSDSDNSNNSFSSDFDGIHSVENVVEFIIICTGLPLTLLAIVAVCYLVRKDHLTPVFIINLLISDVIQLCSITAWKAHVFNDIIDALHCYGLLASIGFMVCISLERYLGITKPLWYRFRRNVRTSVIICAVVWTLPLGFVLSRIFFSLHISIIVFVFFLILPLPLFIFSLVGSIKALSAAVGVPADEKRRIVAILVTVLLIYILLYLPAMICSVKEEARNNYVFSSVAEIFLLLSPLSDLILYFFLRKGFTDKLLILFSCCEMSDSEETTSPDVGSSASC